MQLDASELDATMQSASTTADCLLQHFKTPQGQCPEERPRHQACSQQHAAQPKTAAQARSAGLLTAFGEDWLTKCSTKPIEKERFPICQCAFVLFVPMFARALAPQYDVLVLLNVSPDSKCKWTPLNLMPHCAKHIHNC